MNKCIHGNKVHRILGFFIFLVVLSFTGQSLVWGYDEILVVSGGTLTGKVTLKGPVPGPRVFPLVQFPFGPFCKKISDGKGYILLEEFLLGNGKGMQDAVIAIQGIQKGKDFPVIPAKFEAVDCMFHPMDVPDEEQFHADHGGKLRHAHPLVGVVRNGQEISVINKDPIIHNSQVFQSEKGNIILNIPLPPSMELFNTKTLQLEPGKKITQMICGMHEFMQSWGFLVENPYYAKTKRDGKYSIEQIPPGTYKVTAWHPQMDIIEKEITIPPDGTVSLDFEFDGTQVERPHYETQEKFRIGPEALPHQDLEGCEPPYC